MAITTFSGPIKAGTIKNTSGTTLGTDVKNTGQVVMAQTFSTGTTLSSGASAANETTVIIPANSQIIDIVLDKVTAMVDATAVFSVGDTVGGNSTFINEYSMSQWLLELDEHIQQKKLVVHWLGLISELQT